MDDKDLFAPPSEQELNAVESVPTQDQSDLFAAPSEQELQSVAPQQEAQPNIYVEQALETKAPILTAVGVEGLRSKAADLGQAGLERIGKLSPQEMQTITAQPDLYKKSRSFQDLLEEFRGLGDNTRQKGFDFANQAKESLKGVGPIRGQDLIESISRTSSAPMVDLPASELPQPQYSTQATAQLQTLAPQKAALEAKLQAMLDSGIESPGMAQQIQDAQAQLQDINSQTQRLSRQAASDLKTPKMPNLSDYSQATNIPEEILAANPSLQTKRMGKNYGDVLAKEVDFLKGGEIPAYDVGKKYIQQLQDAASYSLVPDETAKFKQEIARNVSEHLKSQPGAEDYAHFQKQSQEAINVEKGLKEFGIGLDSEGNYKITNQNKIQKIYKDGNQSEISRLEKLIQEAQDLGYNPQSSIDASKLSQIDRFQKEIPLSSIKKRVSEIQDSKLAQIGRSTIGGTFGGVPGAIAGAVAPTGTKLQEVASLTKGTKAYKGLAKASKFLGPAVGLAVAGVSYADARDQGLNVPEALGTTVGEVLNPIPLTDITGAYVAGKKEYQKSGEILPTASAAGSAFAKPLTSQMEKTAKGRAENIASNYKMDTGKIINNPEKIANLTDLYNKFKSMTGSKGAEVVSGTIDKALNGSDDEKVKADFLIQQNPMLRNKLK